MARLGGDEFAVLAPDCGLEGANVTRQRLRAAIEELNAQGGEPFRLSVSVGACVYEPSDPATLDELLQRADEAMYEEKRAQAPPSRNWSSQDAADRS